MRKFALTLALAVICTAASMAQTMSISHNVIDPNGNNSMMLSCTYAVDQPGNVGILAYFMDSDGDFLEAPSDYWSDAEGDFVSYGGPYNIRAHTSYTAKMYVPYSVIDSVTDRGDTYYVYFALIDEDNDGEVILESEPSGFSLN